MFHSYLLAKNMIKPVILNFHFKHLHNARIAVEHHCFQLVLGNVVNAHFVSFVLCCTIFAVFAIVFNSLAFAVTVSLYFNDGCMVNYPVDGSYSH